MTRRGLMLGGLVAALAASVLGAVSIGAVAIPFDRVAAALLAPLGGPALTDATSTEIAIVVLQGLFRNPMADPSLIGVSSEGACGAVVAVVTGLAFDRLWTLPLFAFLGAAGATTLIYALSIRQGRTPVAALLLAGLAVSALLTAVTSFLLSHAENVFVLRELVFWLLGGLAGRDWRDLQLILGARRNQ